MAVADSANYRNRILRARKKIADDGSLSWGARRMLALLMSIGTRGKSLQSGEIVASKSYLYRTLHISESQAARHIAELRKSKWVRCKEGGRGKGGRRLANSYRLLNPESGLPLFIPSTSQEPDAHANTFRVQSSSEADNEENEIIEILIEEGIGALDDWMDFIEFYRDGHPNPQDARRTAIAWWEARKKGHSAAKLLTKAQAADPYLFSFVWLERQRYLDGAASGMSRAERRARIIRTCKECGYDPSKLPGFNQANAKRLEAFEKIAQYYRDELSEAYASGKGVAYAEKIKSDLPEDFLREWIDPSGD